MTGKFEPEKFEDRYENAMIELIRSKQAGAAGQADEGRNQAEQRRQPDGCAEAQHRCGRCESAGKEAEGSAGGAEEASQESGLMADKKSGEVGKRIVFDGETWQALHRLSLDSMKTLQELADEAFRDLLKKHGRPTNLKEMLRQSARLHPANDERTDRQGPARKK